MNNNTPKRSRSEQARINGANSKGPTSSEGKAISSRNALKHGFAAVINNVISVEDKEAFELHAAGYRAAFTPQNYFEETLIDQLASVNWRQTRLAGLETALFDAQLSVQSKAVDEFEGDDADPYVRMVYAWHALARKSEPAENPEALAETFDIHCLELVRRYITTLDRQYRNTLLNLRQYRKDFAPPQPVARPNEPKDPPAKVAEVAEEPVKPTSRVSVLPMTTINPKLVTPEPPAKQVSSANKDSERDRK